VLHAFALVVLSSVVLHTTQQANMNTSLTGDAPQYYLCQATPPGLQTLFMPPDFQTWLGQKSSTLCCCMQDESSMCILPSHKDFDTLHTGDKKDDVCCLLHSGETALVKPLCLTGEKPVCVGSQTGCCCSQRFSCPSDKDVPWMCAAYGLKCCECLPFAFTPACCTPMPPPPAVLEPKPMDVAEPKVSDDEHLICAFGFGMCSMYIPETYHDAFGVSEKSLCCCIETDTKKWYLGRSTSAYEMLLCFSGQIKMIKPPVLSGGPLCKGVQRNWFMLCKFAVPCDSEVPFAIACPGYKCAEKPKDGPCICCKDDRQVDPQTGMKQPLFPVLTKPEQVSYSVSAPAYEEKGSAYEGGGAPPDSEAMVR